MQRGNFTGDKRFGHQELLKGTEMSKKWLVNFEQRSEF